jgi:glutathione S-transferase
MTDHLAIGDRGYSSWSLRGWLLFDAFGLSVTTDRAQLYTDELARLLAAGYGPAKTAPALRFADGTIVMESLAIAEELATRHPGAGHWPTDPRARATARSIAAEMHAGFQALRGQCPMNLRVSYAQSPMTDALAADLARLEKVWAWARDQSGATGDWLCGPYSIADAFFAPVASRIATYNLPVGPAAQAYVAAHLAHPSFRRWRAMGLVDGPDQAFYRRDHTTRPWPGPAPLPAMALTTGTPENDGCLYSGKPITHLMSVQGRTFGFCNAFCRDKSVADPLAWPELAARLA